MASENLLRRSHLFKDITGQRFGRWTVLRFSEQRRKKSMWECRCDCGNEGVINGTALRHGGSKSCGCLKIEVAIARLTKHGMKGTPEYRCWKGITERCLNQNKKTFANYGGRGIKMCERWRHSFENFFADMGPKPTPQHSIERINNDGDYEPENCRWATRIEQSRNKRSNVIIRLTLVEAAQLTGMPYDTVKSRILRGWSHIDALTTPVDTPKSRQQIPANA